MKKKLYLCGEFYLWDMKRSFVFAFFAMLVAMFGMPSSAQTALPHDSVPEDHLAWFGLKGPVKQMVEYDYCGYGKKVWRFDTKGRLREYIEYTHPFFESGGCVFGLWAHYRYGYDANGAIEYLETYNADYNKVDEYGDSILELFPPRQTYPDLRPEAENEFGDTTFCYSRWQEKGDKYHYDALRYDAYGNWFETVHTTLDSDACANVRVRDITYYDSAPQPSGVPVGELTVLPPEINMETAFGLVFHYGGYVFEGALYPLHEGWWVVLSHWCLDEMEEIYLDEEDANGDPIPAASRYKDPFAGKQYPIIKTDSVSFSSRNYGGETIKLYKEADGKRVWDKLKVPCHLDVVDADAKTRRLLCRTNPNAWDWDENPQYYAVYGWMDEEWVCANLLTTCP